MCALERCPEKSVKICKMDIRRFFWRGSNSENIGVEFGHPIPTYILGSFPLGYGGKYICYALLDFFLL